MELTTEQFSEKWISELYEAGYSYDDMTLIFQEANRKVDAFKKKEFDRYKSLLAKMGAEKDIVKKKKLLKQAVELGDKYKFNGTESP